MIFQYLHTYCAAIIARSWLWRLALSENSSCTDICVDVDIISSRLLTSKVHTVGARMESSNTVLAVNRFQVKRCYYADNWKQRYWTLVRTHDLGFLPEIECTWSLLTKSEVWKKVDQKWGMYTSRPIRGIFLNTKGLLVARVLEMKIKFMVWRLFDEDIYFTFYISLLEHANRVLVAGQTFRVMALFSFIQDNTPEEAKNVNFWIYIFTTFQVWNYCIIFEMSNIEQQIIMFICQSWYYISIMSSNLFLKL